MCSSVCLALEVLDIYIALMTATAIHGRARPVAQMVSVEKAAIPARMITNAVQAKNAVMAFAYQCVGPYTTSHGTYGLVVRSRLLQSAQ